MRFFRLLEWTTVSQTVELIATEGNGEENNNDLLSTCSGRNHIFTYITITYTDCSILKLLTYPTSVGASSSSLVGIGK